MLPPAVSALVDWSSLERLPGSHVDASLKERHSDVLFRVRLIDGRQAFIYLLLEHQSGPDALMTFRLLRYQVRIWDEWIANAEPPVTHLPAIVPIVLHNGPGGWTAPTRMAEVYDLDVETLEVLRPHLPMFEMLLDDLHAHDDDSLLRRAMTGLARLALLCLKHARTNPALRELLSRWLGELWELVGDGDETEAANAVARYILEVSKIGTAELAEVFEQAGSERAKEAVVTTGQQLIEQGRKEGRREGRREGRNEGERLVVARLLAKKFGELSDAVRGRLEAATVDELEQWAERLLTAESLDEVFATG